MKNKKKAIIIGLSLLSVISISGILGLLWWKNLPEQQFLTYCHPLENCICASKQLTLEQQAYIVTLEKYKEAKKNGKATKENAPHIDIVSAAEIVTVMKSCEAEGIRKQLFNNIYKKQQNSKNNYLCMLDTFANQLSNREIIFFNSNEFKNITKNNVDLFLSTFEKITKCMPKEEQIQFQKDKEAFIQKFKK